MAFQHKSYSCQNTIHKSGFLPLQGIATSIQNASETDIKELLQLLHTTDDVELHLKVFSLFAIYLLSGHGTYRAAIITFPSIYDKIHDMLIKGYPVKTGATLNFVSSLLYEGDEHESTATATLYARNMLRVSGCLSVMCSLFCSSNMAIQKCINGDVASALVLQSLLNHHQRNAQLFVDCGGLSIFNREHLQNNAYLQLLDTVVQNPKSVIILVHNEEIVDILRKFLDSYGMDSQIGQWSTVILYHIKLQVHGLGKVRENARIKENVTFRIDLTTLNKTDDNDTTTLLQNVIGEVLQYEQDNKGLKKCSSAMLSIDNELFAMRNKAVIRRLFLENNKRLKTLKDNTTREYHESNFLSSKCLNSSFANEMSFSFLFNEKVYNNNTYTVPNWQLTSVHELNKSTPSVIFEKTNIGADLRMKNIRAGNQNYISTNNKYEQSVINFKPKFVSTPKRNNLRKNRQSLQTSNIFHRYLSNTKFYKEICNGKRINKQLNTQKNKELKHKSFSGKVFSTINDSCTILIKTVKNIFKTLKVNSYGQKEESSFMSSSGGNENYNCSYSFTNYMRRRDAIFEDKPLNASSPKSDEFDLEINSGHSCDTCNDTLLLNHKLTHDKHLRQTIMKLKYGINLYGCDFKKISTVLFPRDSYLTPSVLYNLYRKLITK